MNDAFGTRGRRSICTRGCGARAGAGRGGGNRQRAIRARLPEESTRGGKRSGLVYPPFFSCRLTFPSDDGPRSLFLLSLFFFGRTCSSMVYIVSLAGSVGGFGLGSARVLLRGYCGSTECPGVFGLSLVLDPLCSSSSSAPRARQRQQGRWIGAAGL
jgi:hypothetical protein